MSQILKYSNILFFILAITLFFLLFPREKITQEVLDLFPKTSDREVIDIYREFANSHYVFVAIKGFSQDSKEELERFLARIENLSNVQTTLTHTQAPKALQDFIASHYVALATPKENIQPISPKDLQTHILTGVQNLATELNTTNTTKETAQEEFRENALTKKSDSTATSRNATTKETATQKSTDTSRNANDTRRGNTPNIDSNKASMQDTTKENPTQNNTASTQNTTASTQETTTQNTPSANKPISPDSQHSTPAFNPYDPLNAFSLPPQSPQPLMAKDYGYVGLVELKSLEDKDIQATIADFESIAKDFPNIRYFSQNFMDSINLTLILNEVTFLLTFASVLFAVLYFIIIRIPMLTINTIATLIGANIVAMFVVSSVYPKVTIMALSFGMGISNIAIDYMMHHNFFSLYAPKRSGFNRPVFYGYITTIVGFATCLFIPFPLLAQLSLYAIVSLTISYCFFAFLYPRIGFTTPRFFPQLAKWQRSKIPSAVFLSACVVGFVFVGLYIKFDFDLSKLGYENKPLLKERDFFAQSFEEHKQQILLSANSPQALIALSSALQSYIATGYAHTDSTPSIIPLSLLRTQQGIESNKAFLQTPAMRHNIRTLQALLPQLESAILQSIDEEHKEAVRSLFITMRTAYDESRFDDIYATLTQEALNAMGFSVIERGDRLYYLVMVAQADMPLVLAFSKELAALKEAGDSVEIEAIAKSKIGADKIGTNGGANAQIEAGDSTRVRLGADTEDNARTQEAQSDAGAMAKADIGADREPHTESYTQAAHDTHIHNAQLPDTQMHGTQTEAQSWHTESTTGLWHIEPRSLQRILDNLTDTIYTPMLIVLGIALCAMLITLGFTARKAFMECVAFILFPLCVALCVIASHSALNIMHLFALLILVVVSVDYGIYSAKEGMGLRTAHAIFFSAITTGVSFGILLISDTKALNSFGEVIFSGMGCILLLLFLAKVPRKKTII